MTAQAPDQPDRISHARPHVCVIGGGVAGLATSLALHAAGFAVTIVEADRSSGNDVGFSDDRAWLEARRGVVCPGGVVEACPVAAVAAPARFKLMSKEIALPLKSNAPSPFSVSPASLNV